MSRSPDIPTPNADVPLTQFAASLIHAAGGAQLGVGPSTILGVVVTVVSGVGAIVAAILANDTATATGAAVATLATVSTIGGRVAQVVARVRSVAAAVAPIATAVAAPALEPVVQNTHGTWTTLTGSNETTDEHDLSAQGRLAAFDGDMPEDNGDVPDPHDLDAHGDEAEDDATLPTIAEAEAAPVQGGLLMPEPPIEGDAEGIQTADTGSPAGEAR